MQLRFRCGCHLPLHASPLTSASRSFLHSRLHVRVCSLPVPQPDYLQQQQKKDTSSSRSAATAATALNPSAANALATAAAMGLLRIPPGSGPIMPFPFPMLNPQLMLQILQNNPQANATLQAAAAAAAAGQQQQQMMQQQLQQQHHQQQVTTHTRCTPLTRACNNLRSAVASPLSLTPLLVLLPAPLPPLCWCRSKHSLAPCVSDSG